MHIQQNANIDFSDSSRTYWKGVWWEIIIVLYNMAMTFIPHKPSVCYLNNSSNLRNKTQSRNNIACTKYNNDCREITKPYVCKWFSGCFCKRGPQVVIDTMRKQYKRREDNRNVSNCLLRAAICIPLKITLNLYLTISYVFFFVKKSTV